MSWLFGALAGLAAGVLSGFGIGGGTLLILWLTLVQQMEQLRAGGVNLLYFIACALPALWGHAKNGLLEKQAVLWCAAGGVPACIAGALLASWLDVALLRRGFGVFLLAVGLREVFHRRKPEDQRSR
ncbi:sulfite exporter TauE/SafE family protein [Oscillospiraceae bacterium 42-9]|uniref:sulfite exporter TauE/SafE family protein n=1 Tax=Acutalibacter sp. TaxID=1918636 RepID=UPI0034DFA5EE